MTASQVDFRPFLNFAGVYTEGLSALLPNGQQGTTLGDLSSGGATLTFGVSGLHRWQHTSVGLDYSGSFSHYFNYYIPYGNLQNHTLMMSFSHQFTPHATLTLRENANVSSQPLASPTLPEAAGYDPASAYNPTTDFYNNRTIFLTTAANFIFQKSARLSFSLGGDGSLTERQGLGLYSVTGAGANGDVQYRLSSHTTIGATYSYTHYEFHGTFNANDIHSVAASYSARLTRSLEFTGYGGVSKLESKFLQGLPISPTLSSLIGLASGTVIHYSDEYHPNYNGRLSQTFQHGVVFIASSYAVSPGNGLFLTSTALNASMGYAYNGLRVWSLGATAAYNRSNSIENIVGEYGGASLNISASRELKRSLHFTCGISAMRYESSSFSAYNRLTYSASLGLAYSPGNLPLRIW